ncbi:MAG: ABC transporter substrate-binding protein [Chloroflexota bacterium]
MSRSIKWMSLLVVLLLGCVLSPIQADEAQGGMIVEGGFGDFGSLNPLFESNTITKLLFPDFIGVDPDTGWFQKDAPNALVTDWTVSDDGRVYTFKLRDDWRWSDGKPITSADVMYPWEAINSGVIDTPLTYLKDYDIRKVEVPDKTTVRITFWGGCDVLNFASILPVLPSHILPKNFADLNTSAFNSKPSVSGRYQVSEVVPHEHVVLRPNPDWAGGVAAAGYTYQYEPDQTQLLKDFTAGKLDIITGQALETYAELRNNPNVNRYTFPGNTWDFLALNEADPILGDVHVRQALAKAIDVDTLIKEDAAGEATRMASAIIPSSWAYDHDLQPIPYDLTEAERLLDKAGWVDDDHNPSTPRVAKDANYVVDGTPFKFTLYADQVSSRQSSVAKHIQEQLGLLGIQVDYEALDTNALSDHLNKLTYDAALFTWRSGYPDNPDFETMFDFTFYDNPSVSKELNAQASSLPGCDVQARAKIYGEIQELLQQDLPFIWLYSLNEMYAAQKTIKGFDPRPNQLHWNIEKWSVTQP